MYLKIWLLNVDNLSAFIYLNIDNIFSLSLLELSLSVSFEKYLEYNNKYSI